MLTKLVIGNFKSIFQTIELDVAPLTVLAGPNSSGKSTVIQSILLIAQTLSSRRSERELLLNGEFARLGSFDDLLHCKVQRPGERRVTRSGTLQIGFDLKRSPSETEPSGGPMRELLPTVVSVRVKFTRRPERHGGYAEPGPSVSRYDMAVRSVFEDGEGKHELDSSMRVTRRGGRIAGVPASLLSAVRPREEELCFRPRITGAFVATHTSKGLRGVLTQAPVPEPIGSRSSALVPIDARFSHFLPTTLVVYYDSNDMRLRTSLDALLRSIRFGRQLVRRTQPISPDIADFVNECAGELVKQLGMFEEYSTDDYLVRVRQLSPTNRHKLVASLQEGAEAWITTRLRGAEQEFEMARIPLPPPLSDAVEWVNKYFSTSIQYLGPLREDPRAVYAPPHSGDPADVGLKGEYTAAVLDANKRVKVSYWNPELGRVVEGTLSEAVQFWMRLLGLAESVQTEEAGKLGHILKLRETNVPKDLDLTNVGVGVSQVLPILVMAFLARPGSTLIYEQPEIHLHPKIQSQIADFFLGVVQCGKRCIVETHSEYLVSRLRRRIAECRDDELSRKVSILFVEKTDSVSSFRKVAINKFGAVLDWPDGFFDQGQLEAEMIIDAAMRKRTEGGNA